MTNGESSMSAPGNPFGKQPEGKPEEEFGAGPAIAPSGGAPAVPHSRWRWWRPIGVVLTLAVVVASIAGTWALRQTRHVPDFYAQATRSDPPRRQMADTQMRVGVEKLQSDAARIGSWRASFTADQINAWLQNELPQKFPNLLARGASEPRVAIVDGKLMAAARYRKGGIDTVVSCELAVQLTDQPNMLAMRITNLRAGALPLPLGRFINGISNEAARGDLWVRWDQTDDGPVALVRVPTEHPLYKVSPVIVENVSLIDGSLQLAGHSGPLAPSVYRPHGPVHEFVSYRPPASARGRFGSLRNQPSRL